MWNRLAIYWSACYCIHWKINSKRIRSVLKPSKINRNFFWKKDNKVYAKIDGIFCEILTERQTELNGTTYTIYFCAKINKSDRFYIANKDNFYAHADELKKAFEDLEFKIIAEKLKKDPIKKDTVITMQYYRIITGACEMGCKNWMEQNKITTESITAEKLLPILEKSGAYGLESFKRLIQF